MAGSNEILEYLIMGVFSFIGDAEIRDIEDYTQNIDEHTVVVGADLSLRRSDIYPLKDCRDFAYDSMAPMIAGMSQLPEQDRVLYQVVCLPIKDGAKSQAALMSERASDFMIHALDPKTWCKADLFPKTDNKKPDPTHPREKAKKKCLGHLYWVSARCAAMTRLPVNASATQRSEAEARLSHHVRSTLSGVMVYNTVDENSFKMGRIRSGRSVTRKLQARSFTNPFRLSSIEVTTIWHPPTLGTLPNTAQVLSKRAPPPRKLPSSKDDPQICFFGQTNYRDSNTPFGIKRFDRRRHLYVIGKSGVGKSCLLQLLIRSDVENGFGCCVLDPHGDLVDDVLRLIPKRRIKDVVLFDPSDVKHPPSFNPLVPCRPELKAHIVHIFLDVFRRNIGDGWSDKVEHVLRHTLLALLHVPGATIVMLRRMLSDEDFRNEIVSQSPDESVQRFWLREFVHRRQEFEEGPISQIMNRMDQLLATDMIRNILGQAQNLYDFREFMDNRKIVLLKMSKGLLGAADASFLGSLAIWKVYEAAMSRADMVAEARQDFYFYIDEFQNFATESFGDILSESRKYKLCLTFANQFLGQLPDSIRQNVFGNVANTVAFRIGPEDSGAVSQEFKPRISPSDLLNLGLREFFVKMSVDGEAQEAFSGRTIELNYPADSSSAVKECVTLSRSKYALTAEQVEEQLALAELETAPRVVHG
jgi:GTPase SAR1 family protein